MVRQTIALGFALMLGSTQVFAQQILFNSHPEINQKVGQFTESLILAMAPEFDQGKFQYNLSKSDLSRGKLVARFDGVTSKTEVSHFNTPMVVGTDILFSITNENDKEYALNLDLVGQVSETKTVIDYLVKALKPKCLENSAMAGASQADIEKLCAVFDDKFNASSKTPVDNFALLVEEWKKQVLLLIENKSNTKSLKATSGKILTDYVNQQITTQKKGDKLFVEINLENLGKDLTKTDKELVKSSKLDVIRVNKMMALVSNRVVEYDISLTKLHSKKTIDKGMEFGKGFQNTIEDPISGKKIGEGLRSHLKGNSVDGMFSLLMGANKMDAAGAVGKIASEKASNAFNGLLQSLGLAESTASGTKAATGASGKATDNKHKDDEEDLGL